MFCWGEMIGRVWEWNLYYFWGRYFDLLSFHSKQSIIEPIWEGMLHSPSYSFLHKSHLWRFSHNHFLLLFHPTSIVYPLILFKISHSILPNETEPKCYEYSYPLAPTMKSSSDCRSCNAAKSVLCVKKHKGAQGSQFIVRFDRVIRL